MEKTVVTNVIVVSANQVDEEEAQLLADQAGYDNIEEYAEHLEADLEAIVAHQLFGEADNIPILDVSTEVYDDWDEEDIGDIRTYTEEE